MLKPSPTLAMTSRAKAMKQAGRDVISFAAGEPDFNTPASICEAAQKALEDGQTKYCASSGLPALREAVSEKLERENGLRIPPDQVIVSCGAKHSIYNALQVLVEPGDEVILIAPYWMTYYDQVQLAGGMPVTVQTSAESGFCPSIDDLTAVVTPRTKAIIINSPSNPTGAAYSADWIALLAEFALRHNLWVISDEIYERLIYDHRHLSIASLSPEIAAQTVTVTGVSKTYAMTGWRIGFAAAAPAVVKAMSNLQDQMTSNAATFAQFGAIAALRLPDAEVAAMRDEFRVRRDQMSAKLRGIPGISVHEPQGAFYLFPRVTAFLGGDVSDDVKLAEYLLDRAEAATIPGSVFSGPGHLRLSYAASRADIDRGLDRIHTALTALAP